MKKKWTLLFLISFAFITISCDVETETRSDIDSSDLLDKDFNKTDDDDGDDVNVTDSDNSDKEIVLDSSFKIPKEDQQCDELSECSEVLYECIENKMILPQPVNKKHLQKYYDAASKDCRFINPNEPDVNYPFYNTLSCTENRCVFISFKTNKTSNLECSEDSDCVLIDRSCDFCVYPYSYNRIHEDVFIAYKADICKYYDEQITDPYEVECNEWEPYDKAFCNEGTCDATYRDGSDLY